MVLINFQVSFDGKLEIDARMLYQLVQHVVVEFEAGVDPWCSGSVQIQKQADFSFFRVSFQFGPSGTGAAEIINNFRPGGQGGVCFGVVFFAEKDALDRTSVVWGKRVSVRVDLGG